MKYPINFSILLFIKQEKTCPIVYIPVREGDHMVVIDWPHFTVTDFRFDLSWTLILAHAYGWTEMRDQILHGYEYHFGKSVEQIEAFEAIACARRLFDITISLTLGPQQLGMTAQAVESMRASMEAHRRVNHLFIERTGFQIKAFDEMFGKS